VTSHELQTQLGMLLIFRRLRRKYKRGRFHFFLKIVAENFLENL